MCVFEKRKQNHNVQFIIDGENIKIVDNFTNLGIILSQQGYYSHSVKVLCELALKAYHNLLMFSEFIFKDPSNTP